jgi:hypothetical protein
MLLHCVNTGVGSQLQGMLRLGCVALNRAVVPLRARGVSTCGLALLEQPISQPDLATTRCPLPFQHIIDFPGPHETSTLARYVSAGGVLSPGVPP